MTNGGWDRSMKYKNYIFDLYGTLVDINTDEEDMEVWTKLAYFYGYYNAYYSAKELEARYLELVGSKEMQLGDKVSDVHEAHPEIRLEEVFSALYEEKGVNPSDELVLHTGQFFRVLTTKYIRLYDGVIDVLSKIKEEGNKVYSF